jgi:hypothetical protein
LNFLNFLKNKINRKETKTKNKETEKKIKEKETENRKQKQKTEINVKWADQAGPYPARGGVRRGVTTDLVGV